MSRGRVEQTGLLTYASPFVQDVDLSFDLVFERLLEEPERA
ncbi:MAG: hypothetical protein QM736_00290 [Vicinamibacterales bacterium]